MKADHPSHVRIGAAIRPAPRPVPAAALLAAMILSVPFAALALLRTLF
ncbi:hypothetical protein KUH32_12185 [Thalassococcus sp. CAU 1522]|uniref:Uncharacterized protein n=1 Tax=Thalassococcus arenae TaxID=2851652 RepID=A0ABS6N963_9RHOB|nr:hypothetical protein [Thalassococcus arenae]MBV2360537.1 hypothetical protein [Thalassococcus arenae]